MAAEHHVLGGLAGPGARVHVAGDGPCALGAHEIPAVVRLGHQFRAGRQVEHDLRPGEGEVRARRTRRPEILADLDAEGRVPQLEHEIGAQRKPAQGVVDLGGDAGAGGEPALLVELLVVRLRDLGNRAEYPTAAAGEGAVEYSAVRQPPRRPDHQNTLVRRLRDLHQRRMGGVAQVGGREQILAGVAGDAELRLQDDRGVARRLGVGVENRPHVRRRVRNDHRRRGEGHLDEAEFGEVRHGTQVRGFADGKSSPAQPRY